MKHDHDTTPAQVGPSLAEMSRWPLSLRQLHERLAPYFTRSEPRHHALLYLQAVLSDIPRKNGWQIAEQAHQLHPYGMQRLLSLAAWDHEGVREELRSFLAQSLKPPAVLPASAQPQALFPVLVVDESGFPKRGRHSAGVQPQYCGATGQVQNCQVGVFLSYVTALGHGLIDRQLYLPEEWCRDVPRRQAAHIPPSVGFQTKPELARAACSSALTRPVCPSVGWWATPFTATAPTCATGSRSKATLTPWPCRAPKSSASTPHRAADLGRWVSWLTNCSAKTTGNARERAWAPRASGFLTGPSCPWCTLGWWTSATGWSFAVAWMPRTNSTITWSLLPQARPCPPWYRPLGQAFTLKRTCRPPKRWAWISMRVRSYVGWYRHVTLVLLAYAFLVSLCLEQSSATHPPEGPAASPLPCPPPAPPLAAAPCPAEPGPAAPPLIPLTPSEVRHLLSHLFWPAPTSASLICHWSCWRRTHQYWAGYYHRRRREKAHCA